MPEVEVEVEEEEEGEGEVGTGEDAAVGVVTTFLEAEADKVEETAMHPPPHPEASCHKLFVTYTLLLSEQSSTHIFVGFNAETCCRHSDCVSCLQLQATPMSQFHCLQHY